MTADLYRPNRQRRRVQGLNRLDQQCLVCLLLPLQEQVLVLGW